MIRLSFNRGILYDETNNSLDIKESPISISLLQVVKQFEQAWTTYLKPETILNICHKLDYPW